MFATPKFSISIVLSFSWGHFNSPEKLKTMLMQNFGVTNKEYYGMLWYFLEWSIVHSKTQINFPLFLFPRLAHAAATKTEMVGKQGGGGWGGLAARSETEFT